MALVVEKNGIMEKIEFGNTGVKVSDFCLGTMYFVSKTGKSDAFRFLDSANKYASWVQDYSGGESESVLGEWLQVWKP